MDQLEAVIYKFPMTGTSLAKTDETGAVPVAAPQEAAEKSDGREFLAETQRKLTLEEAASAAGIQWFQYEIRRLDRDTNRLQEVVTSLRERNDALVESNTDKRVEIESLKGKANELKRNEVLSTLAIACGSAGLGATPGFLAITAAHDLAAIGLSVSVVLVIAGVFLRVWK